MDHECLFLAALSLSCQAGVGQKQTFKHYLELSRGTFLKLKGPRIRLCENLAV